MIDGKQIPTKPMREVNHMLHTHDVVRGSRWLTMLLHRWPSLLGVAVAGLLAADLNNGTEFSALLVVMALVYLGAAVLARQWSAWMLMILGVGAIFLLAALNPGVEPLMVLLVPSSLFLVAGAVQVMRGRASNISLQSFGMIIFSLIALIAFYGNPVLGGYLIAAGLFAHGTWDAVHFHRNRVVTRSYAEFCSVVDFVLGMAILVTIGLR